MPKQQLNLRVSNLTLLQLKHLQQWWGTSQTETLTLIIDRAYTQARDGSGYETAQLLNEIQKNEAP